MRVGISGAQSVGKTTLLNALKKDKVLSSNYTMCEEITRRVKNYGLPINEDGTDITQTLIMQEHLVNAIMHTSMITDRTVLDGLVYTTYLHKKKKVTSETLAKSRAIFRKVWPMYKFVFYIEPEFDIVNDGVRSIDIDFRNEIADTFERVMVSENVGVHRINGSVENRVELITKLLKGRA
jgi:predicted ATPase